MEGWAPGAGPEVTRSHAAFRGSLYPGREDLRCSVLLPPVGVKAAGRLRTSPMWERALGLPYSWSPTPVWVGMPPSYRPGAQLREEATGKTFWGQGLRTLHVGQNTAGPSRLLSAPSMD